MKLYDVLQNGNKASILQHSAGSTILLLTSSFLFIIILTLSLQPSALAPLMSWSGISASNGQEEGKCNIFKGDWVPNPEAPYYTNETCRTIHQHQNCMKYGRPDTEFMKWRWKPKDCELPVFDPSQFLELVRGKSLAFVGDSVARNHMQSLICLLSRVANAEDVSLVPDQKFPRYHFPANNFTVASFWAPYLVRAQEDDPHGSVLSGLYNLYLDEPDANWTSHVQGFHYVVVSAGHWFFRPAAFFERGRPAGCYICGRPNVTALPVYHGYRAAFRTALAAFVDGIGFQGVVFLRTFSPAHFENGEWNKGGDCARRRPLNSREAVKLDGGVEMEMRRVQVEELEAAVATAAKGRGGTGVRFRLLDTTMAMAMRPDGHPSRYGHLQGVTVNDCVHWCLPGPIDAWNDLLFHMLKEEVGEGPQDRHAAAPV